jgi:hypothetical protein
MGVLAVTGVLAITTVLAVTGGIAVIGVIAGTGPASAPANAPPSSALLSQAKILVQGPSPLAARLLVPLQCRLAAGAWQNCAMRVERLGEHWWLELGRRRIEFRHDGHGGMAMRWPGGPWQSVNSRWNSDGSLCWDGICARGAIPLD